MNYLASSQPRAVEAGLALFAQGGNAIDAALACAACLTVVEPCSNGLGGDLFALVWDGQQLHGLNASGRSPRAWSPELFSHLSTMPARGWDSITVPGMIAGWKALHQRFGSRSFADCLQPAIDAADNGFTCTPAVAQAWQRGLQQFGAYREFQQTFAPTGTSPQAGEQLCLVDHANTLRRIAASYGDDFYTGDLAQRIVGAAKAAGSLLDADDLKNHSVEWVQPLCMEACGIRGYELPPNGQGIAALIAAGLCEHLDLSAYAVDDPRAIHLQIEAIKFAFADIDQHLADPAAMRHEPDAFLDCGYLRRQAARINRNEVAPMGLSSLPSTGTVLMVSSDHEGRMVALIQSNFHGFGSGIVIPGTGISMHNRGQGFCLTPGHANQVDGNKRPFHTIIPGFWQTLDGHPIGPFGCMGAEMQAQGHLQLWQRLFRWQQTPQQAIDAPRWRLQRNGTVLVEKDFDPIIAQKLGDIGHTLKTAAAQQFGGAQIITHAVGGQVAAGSESRKDGYVGHYPL